MDKVLLILESDMMQKALSDALAGCEVSSCPACRAAEILAAHPPDALVLDLFLPGTDGFSLLEDCRAFLPPVVLLLSVLDSDYVRKKAVHSGVDFLIRKPCSIDYIARHLTDMLQMQKFPNDPADESPVDELLSQFHLHAKERSLNALRSAILLYADDPDSLLTKEIYAKVCGEYGATTDAVDQSIRRCLRKAWHNRFRHPFVWEAFFPDQDTCPSNGMFIATLAASLRKKYPSRFRKGS